MCLWIHRLRLNVRFGVTWWYSRPIDRINDAKELCPNFVSRKLSWFVHLGQATTQPRERRCFDSFMLLLFIFFSSNFLVLIEFYAVFFFLAFLCFRFLLLSLVLCFSLYFFFPFLFVNHWFLFILFFFLTFLSFFYVSIILFPLFFLIFGKLLGLFRFSFFFSFFFIHIYSQILPLLVRLILYRCSMRLLLTQINRNLKNIHIHSFIIVPFGRDGILQLVTVWQIRENWLHKFFTL